MNDPWSKIEAERITRRRLLGGAALLGGGGLAAAMLAACGGNANTSGKATKSGNANTGGQANSSAKTATVTVPPAAGVKRGSIVYGEGYLGNSLSPNSAVLSQPEIVAVFDALTRLTNVGELQPSLATSWELDPTDNRKWVFHLRDAEWSDGKPFTADDVKFTYDYILDPNNKSALISRLSTVASTDVLDAKTVVVTCKGQGDPILPKRAYEIFIQPKHYVGDPAFGDAAQSSKPIGTGAYLIDSYERGSRITLKANPSSWRGRQGADSVDIRVLTDDQARVAAFLAKEVDIIDILPIPDVQQVQSLSNAKIKKIPASGYNGWDLQYFDAPVSDMRVRLAINHAVDMQTIAKTVFAGLENVMTQSLTTNCFGYNPNIKGYPFDQDEARSLLKQAGYADGFTVKMAYRGNSGIQSKPYAEATASYLSQVGIKTELVPLDINVWRETLYGPRKAEPLFQNTWVSGPELDASIAWTWFVSTNPRNAYNRKDFDNLYSQAVGEFDTTKRQQLFWQIGQILYEDPPNNWGVEAGQANAYWSNKIRSYSNNEFLDTYVLA